MFELSTATDVFELVLAIAVAYSFFQYINSGLHYKFNDGEAAERMAAMLRIIDATTLIVIVVVLWQGFHFATSLF